MWIFDKIKILPYDDKVKTVEEERRWKLTADDLLKVSNVFESKYCNDIVNLFLAITRGLGFDSQLLKVFKQKPVDQNIIVHSLAIVPVGDKKYIVNVGSKANYWCEEIPADKALNFGADLPNGWYL